MKYMWVYAHTIWNKDLEDFDRCLTKTYHDQTLRDVLLETNSINNCM